MPTVDVVIVNYNGGALLARAVAALQAQSFRDFRIIVVDNGSTDGSLERLESGPIDTKIVRAGRNLGFAAANNLALREHVAAEWMAVLNPDAFPRRDWLERLIAASRANPDFTFFGCRMVDAADPTKLDGVGDAYHVSGKAWREGQGCSSLGRYPVAQEIFSPCAAAALYRTDELGAAGGFDEDFFCYFEDVDLGFRLRLSGKRCLYVADAVVDHVGSGIVGTYSDFQLYHGNRNQIWTFVKNMPGAMFWVYLPWHVAINLWNVLGWTFRGRGRVVLRAKRDALARLGAIRQKRRAIQSQRVAPVGALWRAMRHGWPRPKCPAQPEPNVQERRAC
jgi:GT2 family glycosyltransferase